MQGGQGENVRPDLVVIQELEEAVLGTIESDYVVDQLAGVLSRLLERDRNRPPCQAEF